MKTRTTGTTSEVTKIPFTVKPNHERSEVLCKCGHRRGKHAMYETGFGRELVRVECVLCECEAMTSHTQAKGWVTDKE